MRVLIGLAAAMTASIALAQVPTNTQRVSWAAPTQYMDGTAIPSTVALTYNVYAKLNGAAEVKFRSGVTGTSITPTFPVGHNNCFTITSVVNGAESARSPEACGVVQGLPTKAITTVTVTSPR